MLRKTLSMAQRVIVLLLLIFQVCFAENPPRIKEEWTPQALEFQTWLNKHDVRSRGDFIKKFAAELPAINNTFIPDSKSTQSGQRALLHRFDGTVVVGVGSDHPQLESILINLDTGRGTFHNVFPKDSGPMQLGAGNPQACKRCHTDKLVFIIRPFPQWNEWLGEILDAEKIENPNYKKVVSNPLWKPLLERPLIHAKVRFPVYPYNPDSNRFGGSYTQDMLDHSPNFMATILFARLTAKRIAYDAAHSRPDFFDRYKYSLVSRLLLCDPNENHRKQIHEEYEKLIPKSEHIWLSYFEQADDRFTNELFQILGIQPDEMILKQPLPKNSPDRVAELRKQFAGYFPYSAYFADFRVTQRSMREQIASNLLKSVTSLPLKKEDWDLPKIDGRPFPLRNGMENLHKINESLWPESVVQVCADLDAKATEALKTTIPSNQPRPIPKGEANHGK
jgi:hypothetical protein